MRATGEVEARERFFGAPAGVPVDVGVARAAGGLARRHRAAHTGIDDAGCLIAATARMRDAELLTSNVRHFPMLSDLRAAY
ncbi:MAG: hypothetical protein FJ029_07040 [Actinobacteria bacterium]|nr:hypothetical protein [Actinomycetota bacterium]